MGMRLYGDCIITLHPKWVRNFLLQRNYLGRLKGQVGTSQVTGIELLIKGNGKYNFVKYRKRQAWKCQV
jgi:hypothetical protein